MSMHYARPTLIALALSGLFVQASAQTANVSTLPEVVVSGSREKALPAGQSLPNELMQSRRAATSDTASLLQDVPGVQVYGAGGVSSLPVIHGLADDRLRIKVDGMDLIASCPNHMNPALSYVDPTNLDALKVYAGISPVSVGGDSIGGAIIANTKVPKFAQPGQGVLTEGNVGAFYRSNGNSLGGNVAAVYATESFNISYSGATARSDNYKAGGDFKTRTDTGRADHTLALDEVGSTAYKTTNHTLGFAMKGGDHLFEAKLGVQDMPYQLYPNQRMDMLNNDQKSLNLRYLGQFAWGSLEARAYHERVDHFMEFGSDKKFLYTAGNTSQGMPMRTKGKTSGASAKVSVDMTQQDLMRLGAEYQLYKLNDWWPPVVGSAGMGPNDFQNINNGERSRAALFGEWEKRFSTQWMSLLGIRYERVHTNADAVHGYGGMDMNQAADSAAFNASSRSKSDNNVDMTALAKYTASPMQDIEFGFARKVRSPNLYERYTWSTAQMMMIMNNTAGDGNGYVGDVNLKSEKAHTLSTTFDWHATDRSWEFKATPYYTHVTDYIDAVRCSTANMGTCPATVPNTTPGLFTRLKYANQSARLYGVDLSGKMLLGKTGLGEMGVKGLLSYTNGKNRDTGDDLYNIMPLNARLTLTQKSGGWDNAVELVGVKAKGSVSDVRNEIKTPGYGLVNLRGSYSWQQVRLDFGVENLFDKNYALPLGGAYTGQGTTMTRNPVDMPWGIAVPGLGRSIYAGINYKF